ncbi:hypothetical protein BABINDRAFT_167286 [Babjeviella inositovora NRRL Y-12698]|uniref:RING-type domain-containing protein n=1 Tax=Babjeviella inositovora NRRL Y-12698 TaxID=984486 RepID=A0A1E3QQS6_9ASCO|nr:uncharacterized protein BABINDRAFT_167286 [Babjeviella inositovora NRRL Y-12698]ODQ79422.1 hypothetical protein BABINDRAFT_167286 [Babjeviella inositovora NRRL Y-12698]
MSLADRMSLAEDYLAHLHTRSEVHTPKDTVRHLWLMMNGSANATNVAAASFKSTLSWRLIRVFQEVYSILHQNSQQTLNERPLFGSGPPNPTQLTSGALPGPAAVPEQSSFYGFLYYCISSYAFLCMIMAIVINRTTVFASTRDHRKLPRGSLCVLRILAIVPLIFCLNNLLIALKFYSPGWGRVLQPVTMFDYDGLSYGNSSYMHPFEPLKGMMVPKHDFRPGGPTTDFFWPLYLSICWSQYLEVFISVASSVRVPNTETGLTLFELSLVFQEASLHKYPNTDVLVIILTSLVSQLSIQLLGCWPRVAKEYRLVPSTLIGSSFLVYFGHKFFTKSIFDLPHIIIVAYLPHLIMAVVVVVCGAISLMTCTFTQARFADLSIWNIYNVDDPQAVKMSDDFYTSLANISAMASISAAKLKHVARSQMLTYRSETFIDEMARLAQEGRVGYAHAVDFPLDVIITSTQEKKTSPDPFVDPVEELFSLTETNSSFFNRQFHLIRTLRLFYQLLKSLRSKSAPEFLVKMYPELEEGTGRKDDKRNAYITDDISEEDLAQDYVRLLTLGDFNEVDTSEDFYAWEDLSSDSEVEPGYTTGHIDVSLQTGGVANDSEEDLVNEVISPREVLHLLMNSSDLSEHSDHPAYLKLHLSNRQPNLPLTRSRFNQLVQTSLSDEPFSANGGRDKDAYTLLSVIQEKRQLSDTRKMAEEDEDITLNLSCVVCQSNYRDIIFWPCKCFAICDGCRASLSLRDFDKCVCCRRDVNGFSKVDFKIPTKLLVNAYLEGTLFYVHRPLPSYWVTRLKCLDYVFASWHPFWLQIHSNTVNFDSQRELV